MPHHVQSVRRQLREETLEGSSRRLVAAAGAPQHPRLGGRLRESGLVPVLQHSLQTHVHRLGETPLSAKHRLHRDAAALRHVTCAGEEEGNALK